MLSAHERNQTADTYVTDQARQHLYALATIFGVTSDYD
jgi:hypothetical protein